MRVEGDGYDIKLTESEAMGGTQLTSEAKFDKYFMYGIDNMDSTGNNAPPCGPGFDPMNDPCKAIVGEEDTCCTHVVMTDRDSGTQQSFYRCMNEKIVDMSFSVEIDGMSMAMGCSSQSSSAKYIATAAMASIAALASTLF